MAGVAGRLIALALAGATAGAGAIVAVDPVRTLAGRYSETQELALVTGEEYKATDVVEIVPVDATHAYVGLFVNFYNGHSCSLSGIAERQGRALVYRGLPGDTFAEGEPPCRLTIQRQGAGLTWNDEGGSCKQHCGARGSFHGGDLPWSSKRPIRHLAKLKRSDDYRNALTEWRTGKPAQ